jgi:hypothetical protein
VLQWNLADAYWSRRRDPLEVVWRSSQSPKSASSCCCCCCWCCCLVNAREPRLPHAPVPVTGVRWVAGGCVDVHLPIETVELIDAVWTLTLMLTWTLTGSVAAVAWTGTWIGSQRRPSVPCTGCSRQRASPRQSWWTICRCHFRSLINLNLLQFVGNVM